MANTSDKVLKIAKEEVGYLEKSAAAYKKNKKVLYEKKKGAGSDNYTKYGYEMHKISPTVMDFPAYWCDSFVDWCFYKAYGQAEGKRLLCGRFDDYTVASAKLYQKAGRWHEKPQVGDQIFFRNGTEICHTGIVYKVTSSKVYTIEGNTSGGSDVIANGGGVFKKSYDLNNSRIAGYGRPKYDVKTLTGYSMKSKHYLYPAAKKEVSKRIIEIPKGATCSSLGKKSGNWRYVEYKGKKGWVHIGKKGARTVKGIYKYKQS